MNKHIIYFTVFVAALALNGCKEMESTVSVTYEGDGRVVESDKIDCPETCEATYTHTLWQRKSITLNAQPAPGFETFGWDGCGLGETCVRQFEGACGGYDPALGTCLGFYGLDIDLHAIFVPEGSLIDTAIHEDNKCFLNTSGELHCWPESFASDLPAVENPTKLFLSSDNGCVKDDTGLQCWGNPYIADTPKFEDPDMVITNNVMGCGMDQGTPLCWGSSPENVLDGPLLTGVTKLYAHTPYSGVCADADQGHVCWGRIDASLHQPRTLNAELYALSDESTCAYSTTSGLTCWGTITGAEVISEQLDNPTQLGVGWHHICALDSQGLRCWKNGELIDLPDELTDATGFQQNGNYLCAEDSAGAECWHLGSDEWVVREANTYDLLAISQRGGCSVQGQAVTCWGDKNFWPASFESPFTTTVSQPTSIAVNNNSVCISGLEGLDCRYRRELQTIELPPEDLTSATEVVVGPNETCAIHNNRLSCWGTRARGIMSIPEMTNPRSVKFGHSHICAADDVAVHCWGYIRAPVE